MKKIAVLLGAAALTSGALAENVGWTFQFTLDKYDLHGLTDTAVYLVDTGKTTGQAKVIAYTQQSEYLDGTAETYSGGKVWSQSETEFLHNEKDSITVGGVTYANAKTPITGGEMKLANVDTANKTMSLIFDFHGTLDSALIYGADGKTSPETYDSESLAFVLYDGTTGKTYVIDDVGVTKDRGATRTADFSNIPEPTSGLLMLFGMAGLALKRKRAA